MHIIIIIIPPHPVCPSEGPWPAPLVGWSLAEWRWELHPGCTSLRTLWAEAAAEKRGAPAWNPTAREGQADHALLHIVTQVEDQLKIDRLQTKPRSETYLQHKDYHWINVTLRLSEPKSLSAIQNPLVISYHLIIRNQRHHILVVIGLAHSFTHLWICISLKIQTGWKQNCNTGTEKYFLFLNVSENPNIAEPTHREHSGAQIARIVLILFGSYFPILESLNIFTDFLDSMRPQNRSSLYIYGINFCRDQILSMQPAKTKDWKEERQDTMDRRMESKQWPYGWIDT